jgi:UDP-GlcNAc3NAcA epimerase
MKILTVVGARPQFIKAAVVSRALQEKNLDEVLLHTGQHYDENMSAVFFKEMNIPHPAYNLAVKETSHAAMTAKMLEGIEAVLLKEKPSAVLIYGDTNSTLAAALAAAKLHFPLAHVEAGLRSYNMQMPEEINRIVADKLSSFLFCPTNRAVKNLEEEGFKNNFHHIFHTGDVMLDAALYYFQKSNPAILNALALQPGNFILSTIHRAENTNDEKNLRNIIAALNKINKIKKIIAPLHPRSLKYIQQHDIKTDFTILPPIGYFDMLQLLANCALVITDSGGLQKEACFFKKFCVTLREQTEWTELTENGYSKLAGSDSKKIEQYANELLQEPFSEKASLYGDGNAGKIIAASLDQNFFLT